jgi:hypothetical protein
MLQQQCGVSAWCCIATRLIATNTYQEERRGPRSRCQTLHVPFRELRPRAAHGGRPVARAPRHCDRGAHPSSVRPPTPQEAMALALSHLYENHESGITQRMLMRGRGGARTSEEAALMCRERLSSRRCPGRAGCHVG